MQNDEANHLASLTQAYHHPVIGAAKIREWKMRYGQKCKGGKCRTRL